MQRVLLFMVILFTAVLQLSTAPPLQAADADGPCQNLINVYCTRCHSTSRICDALGTDEAAWKITLREMGENDEDIDQQVQSQVLDCVSGMKKGDPAVCKK